MPTGKGGKKGKRFKNNSNATNTNLLLAKIDNGEQYGVITGKNGGRRFDVTCSDGKNRKGKVCGAMKKKMWVNVGDIVLLNLRYCNSIDNICDIFYKYNIDQAKNLERSGHINFKINTKDTTQETSIIFENVGDDNNSDVDKTHGSNESDDDANYDDTESNSSNNNNLQHVNNKCSTNDSESDSDSEDIDIDNI